MKFAIVQTSLEPIFPEQLRAAFRGSARMTAADAQFVATDAYGVLVRELEISDASSLQLSLQNQGVETQVVAQDQLAQLPATKFLRKLECQPGGLVILDPLNRPITLEWRQVLLVAAGNVATTPSPSFPRTTVPGFGSMAPPSPTPAVHTSDDPPLELLLEIVMGGGTTRYSVRAEQLLAPHPAPALGREPQTLFTSLTQGICAHAPKAILNRGAFLLKNSQPCLAYPARRSFHEEITWLLWRIKQARGSLQAP
jgi:hypothetical protein